MTQIQAIKKEIERLKDRAEKHELLEKFGYKYGDSRTYETGLADAFDWILSFIESLEKEPAVAINTWQDLQSVYVVTKRHLLDYDNGPIEQFPSSTEELFTGILNAIKGGERYE